MLSTQAAFAGIRFDFSAAQAHALAQKRYGHDRMYIAVVEKTGSTNADLLAQAREGLLPEGESGKVRVLFAHAQHSGRGRLQRPWLSTPGACLMMSVATTLNLPIAALAGLPIAAGGVIASVLAEHAVAVQIKWPNDLVVNRAKLGGILIETTSVPGTGRIGIVLGLGLNGTLDANVLQQLNQTATDLNSIVQQELSCLDLALDLAAGLADLLTAPQLAHAITHNIVTNVTTRDACIGQTVRLLNPLYPEAPPLAQGVVVGMTDNGALQLQTDTGLQTFFSGEVSLRWTQ